MRVSKKYLHTYSEELMHKNADEAFDAMFLIENGLLRRDPIHAQNMRSSESNVSSLRHCRVGLPSMGAFLRVKVPSAP